MNEFNDLEQTHQPEQLDPFLVKDKLQAANKLLRRCASDLGARYLADLIDQKASTVHNQLFGGDSDKRPSFDVGIALAFSHEPFRKALCALLCPPPALEASDGISEIERDVLPALGEHDGKKLRSILKRVRR